MNIRLILLPLLLTSLHTASAADDGPLFFTAPEVVVDETTTLLRAKDWKQLTRYYDLTGSKITRAELESGDFFQPKTKNEGQPSFTGKRPFPIGFKFVNVESTSDTSVLRVHAMIEIDQGGGPKQRARASFLIQNRTKAINCCLQTCKRLCLRA